MTPGVVMGLHVLFDVLYHTLESRRSSTYQVKPQASLVFTHPSPPLSRAFLNGLNIAYEDPGQD